MANRESDTYTAQLIGSDHTEAVELDFIDGMPQQRFVRPRDDDGTEAVWELVPEADEAEEYEYREAGIEGPASDDDDDYS